MDRTELEKLLAQMVRAEASSLHLFAGRPPCMRIHGSLVHAEGAPVRESDLDNVVRDFLFEDHRERLLNGAEVEVLITSRQGERYRMQIARQCTGLGITFRPVASRIPDFASLGLPEELAQFCTFRSGLVVVTGFLGSGKSTTLAAMIARLNSDANRHIVTVERPIEFVHASATSLVHQREVGRHVADAATGIREAVRDGADVIAVSHLDDADTLAAVLDASERGCLVLTTVTASSVTAAVAQLLQTAPAEERPRTTRRIAGALRAVVAQALVKRSHPAGRVPLLEILIANQAITRAIRAGDLAALPSIMEHHRGLGMQTADLGLRSLLSRNQISIDEAMAHAIDRSWVAAKAVGTSASGSRSSTS